MDDQVKSSIPAGEGPQSASNITPTAALKVLLLKRLTPKRTDGIFSVVFGEDGIPLVCTIERPWLNNQQGVSSIPTGEYVCRRVPPSPKFPYEHFEVTNVPGRTAILFHKGNYPTDSEGCLLVVTGPMGDRMAGKGSADAFLVFMETLKGLDQFKLVIENA